MTQTENGETTISSNPLLEEFPADVRWLIRSVWDRLPEQRRQKLLDLLPLIPQDTTAGLKKLYELAEDHLSMTFGRRHRVAIVGPANVGKSTLFNQMIREGELPAAVSPVPGTTVKNQSGTTSLFQLIDTPGADAAGATGQQERAEALQAAAEADFLIILFDAIQGIKTSEQALFEELKQLGKPYLVALNKMDLIGKRDREAVVHTAAHNLALQPAELFPLSALNEEGIAPLLLNIAKSEPALLAALGDALPSYRGRLAWQATLRSASTAGLVALTPIPFIDFIPLAAVQGLLVLAIGRIYRYKITPARATELLGSLGMGYISRMLFYELTKLGGPPTWVISVALASATTVLVGYSAMLWFEKGEKLTRPRAQALLKSLVRQLINRLNPLGRSRPGRRKLAEILQESMRDFESIKLGEEQSAEEKSTSG